MPYNGASNGSGASGAGGGGATIVVTEGPQNKKIRTGVQQPGENDVHMHARSTQQQNQQQALMNKSNDDLRRKRPETTRPNHILLFTIINPFYPITVDVLHKICHPHGQVLRIVIFKKNGVQAMVEFDNLDAATRARENLNGADIYAGCCTLKIDYAKPEKLNVYKNEPDTSWDYTLSTVKEIGNGRSPLLQEPLYVPTLPTPQQQHVPTHQHHHHHQQQHQAPPQQQQQQQHHHHQHHQLVAPAQSHNLCQFKEPPLLGPGAAFPPFGAPEYHPTTPENWKGAAIHPTGLMKEPAGVVPGRNAPVAFTPQGQAQGAVMMVYGLDHDTSNTDKLFNLVCLYGNVARIKFLKTKEGTAMVQMGDSVAVERCVQHLNNIPVGTGGKIQIAFSKQNFLSEVINPFLLPDHTPSFKEYTGSKNNRFLSPAQASKNRIQPPSKILHFFNTPPGLTEDQLIGIFNIKDVPATSVRLFPLKTERSSSGLIEFPNISQAVLAIMKCNHLPIEGKGTKFPFIMKLCFSSSKSMNGAWNNATSEGMIEKENEVDTKVDIYN
ncbi:heterogeneous nuclear ribonucleoprotein L-like isoform X1 [Drosophila gunungcola]|uniref:heterogeneous nuclear ribonucleoprotein L-like isoform X1 n=2 Tax=melanogaster group TaxID=32346 RepID=UPI0022E609FA|nr:heterogeneous nuclear ribonucleoprotein L-like isoform X1 [Drosophila gunungcola]XP_052840126.1 heterogeneous nuclear ribonucleoprotein L-like isoform X1 [Drosophila gunungcola]XP_052840127.1 heterogeneous nuclear ribonucleoprotein L-like isoform X1 [Drosophila gunungcola]XP_052840128.1 heterogeneous nuclear ribonucleoprotein L-like isoform X1 [Drosophila gunungcola]XP_052840130.1 heterogeneous nuclear ribonucleoprotein L-like isoform X1 [Drosophila gunungcola]XP_052840131.1 heterogeneous n